MQLNLPVVKVHQLLSIHFILLLLIVAVFFLVQRSWHGFAPASVRRPSVFQVDFL